MPIECRTRPMYVPRSYCEMGRSRLPGSEDDIAGHGRGRCRGALSAPWEPEPRGCLGGKCREVTRLRIRLQPPGTDGWEFRRGR